MNTEDTKQLSSMRNPYKCPICNEWVEKYGFDTTGHHSMCIYRTFCCSRCNPQDNVEGRE